MNGLDDKQLRAALRDSSYRASEQHDRVQDAFERIIRERDAARRSVQELITMLDETMKIMNQLSEHRTWDRADALRAQIYTGFGAFMFGVATVLVAHAAGWV